MDVLSEVLKAVKLESALFFNAELSAPWCLIEPCSAEMAPYLSNEQGHLILYHYVVDGRGFARSSEGEQVDFAKGDVVIFPHGDMHFLGNGSPEKPVDSMKMFEKNLSEGLKLARFGGGGEITRLVCGYMVCDPKLREFFLSGLPKMIKVHVSNEPSGQWLENSIRYSVGDGNTDAGSGLVIAKLSEVLFVETLRRYINDLPDDSTGWLAGARDPSIGSSIALIHRDPANEWTVASLARQVGLSRTRFADRFHQLLGQSPMSYLAKWRLKLGAELLRSGDKSVAEIANAVGYGSEASFGRAFKREFELPPAQFRRARREASA
ncbi:MAG: cupin domain-containing protein [Pyrinomonadaceae bacterium]